MFAVPLDRRYGTFQDDHSSATAKVATARTVVPVKPVVVAGSTFLPLKTEDYADLWLKNKIQDGFLSLQDNDKTVRGPSFMFPLRSTELTTSKVTVKVDGSGWCCVGLATPDVDTTKVFMRNSSVYGLFVGATSKRQVYCGGVKQTRPWGPDSFGSSLPCFIDLEFNQHTGQLFARVLESDNTQSSGVVCETGLPRDTKLVVCVATKSYDCQLSIVAQKTHHPKAQTKAQTKTQTKAQTKAQTKTKAKVNANANANGNGNGNGKGKGKSDRGEQVGVLTKQTSLPSSRLPRPETDYTRPEINDCTRPETVLTEEEAQPKTSIIARDKQLNNSTIIAYDKQQHNNTSAVIPHDKQQHNNTSAVIPHVKQQQHHTASTVIPHSNNQQHNNTSAVIPHAKVTHDNQQNDTSETTF